MAALDDRPPKGWTLSNGVVSPGDRVADFAARGQRVEGEALWVDTSTIGWTAKGEQSFEGMETQ